MAKLGRHLYDGDQLSGKSSDAFALFATSDQYGGKKVDDMSNFVPILDDYTLEVMGTKGKVSVSLLHKYNIRLLRMSR